MNKKWLYALACVCALGLATRFAPANAQGGHPMADKLAERVIEHYQTASCEQLMTKRAQPPSPDQAQKKERAVQMMRNDPELRTYFINKVAGPIANKLFECGMIP